MQKFKRFLSMLLVVVMIVGMVPVNVFATETDCVHSYVDGVCTACGAAESAPVDPTEPEATEATEPEATEPEATEPEATEPEVTEPEATESADDDIAAIADDEPVAKVGNTEYATIDAAIAAWTNNSTLTLLSDVTLTKVIELSSTEYHILDLGTYTMTAASKKDAIQIVNNGRSSASYTLDIKADADNPGGITASGKAVVKTTGKSGVKDRPIIRFYNGVFTGTNVVYHSGSNGTNCPQFWFYGGEFNGTIYANRALFQFYGGTFNGNLQISVDSSAYALISGGRFQKLSNQYGSALNSDKFTIGSAKGNFNRGIYVDSEGYYVVTSEVIKEVSAKYPAMKKESYNSNNYFYYSAAATYGMFYEVASMAGTGDNVTIWEKPAVTIPEDVTGDTTVVEEIKNNTALKDYTPENLPAGAALEIELVSVGETIVYDVTPMANGEKVEPTEEITFRLPVPASVTSGFAKVYHEGTLMGIYEIKGEGNEKYVEVSSADFSEFVIEPTANAPVAQIGEVGYETLEDALAAAAADSSITYIEVLGDYVQTSVKNTSSYYDISGNLTIGAAKKVTLSGCGFAVRVQGNGATLTIHENVTIEGLKVVANGFYTNGENMVINGTVKALSLKQWTSNGTITVSETGSVELGYGDGQFDMAYGNGTVTINGTGDKTAPQFKAGYSGTRGDGNTLNLNNTWFEAGAWFNLSNVTVNVNNSMLTVSGGDTAGSMTIDANSTINMTGDSQLKAGKITGAGKISIDVTGKKGGDVLVSGDATGFNGTVELVNATPNMKYEVTAKGIVLIVNVAQIGEVYYETLQAAVNAVANGQTITLVGDVTENVTLTEAVGLSYTIDGNGKTMNGTITVKALSDTNDNRRITIKNINFKSDAKVDFISSVETNHYPRLTVEGCSFTGNGKAEAVALRLKSSHSVIIKDCSGSGLHSFLQNTSGWNMTVENVTVTNSKGGLALGTVQGVTVKGCNIDVDGYGVRLDAGNNNNAVIESNTVEAFIPVVVRKATVDSTITVTGTNTMTATNTDSIWMAVGTSEYEENGKMPTAATSKVTVTVKDETLDKNAIYGNYAPVSIDTNKYNTLEEAVAAAQAGDTIVLMDDITVAEGETITLNGVNLTAGEGITLTNNGAIEVKGEVILNIATLSDNSIDLLDGAIVKDSTVGGSVFVAGNVTFRGDNTFAMLSDFGTLTDYYGTTAPMAWTVEPGASVTLTNTARYGLGYGDCVTITGTLDDALVARDNLADVKASLVMHGLVAQESKGWNCSSSLNVKDAYVVIGMNNSFGNKSGNYGGTYTINFENAVLDASRITFYEALSTTTFNFVNTDAKVGTFMTRDKDSVFTLTNTKLLSTTATNGNDEGNYHAGKLVLTGSELTYSAPLVMEDGVIEMLDSSLTAPSITGTGKIVIDATGKVAGDVLLNADASGFTGTVEITGYDILKLAVKKTDDGKYVLVTREFKGSITPGYTSATAIWGEGGGNASQSLVVELYEGDKVIATASLNNIGGIINGNVYVTWNIPFAGSNDEYWTVEWAEGYPNISMAPDQVVMVIDGTVVSTNNVQLNGPDNLNKIYAATADADGKLIKCYTSLTAAIAEAEAGQTVALLTDVVLTDTLTIAKSITLNGNGHKLTPADSTKTYNSAIMVGDSGWGDDHGETITLKGLTFEGWKTNHGVVRAQGVTLAVAECEFKNNSVSNASYAVLSLNYTDATVSNTKFVNNNDRAIDVNYNADSSKAVVTINGCTFVGNTTTGAGIVYRNAGTLVVEDSTFKNNTVNTNGNAATLYAGWGTNDVISGCIFEGNTVTTSHTSTKRFASAIFCDGCTVSGNVFGEGNTATRNGETISTVVAVGAYYGEADISGNYWGGKAPVAGVDYTVEYTRNDVAINSYYTDEALNTQVTLTNVAKVGKYYYTTLAEAFAAVENNGTVTLVADIAIDSETITIADGKSVTLDMNGKKITVTDNKTSNYELFYIYGELTVTGNGTIELTATNDRDWNAMSAVFHNRGGVLNIENGTYKHLGGTDMAFVVDNSGNYYGDATTNIEDGTLTSTYTAIRNRMEQNSHGASGKAILNVAGGTIDGTTSAIWAQAASTSTTAPATGEINISGGEIGLVNTARSAGAESMTTITGGTVAAFKGEAGELTVKGGTVGTVTLMTAAGTEVDFAVTADGLYVKAAASIGDVNYATLAEAVKAVQEGETIVILAGTISEGTIKLPATLKNVTFKGAEGAVLKDMTISAADGNGYSYVGLTFDGITFDNSRILLTGWRNGEEVIENLTITNCIFKNLNDSTNTAPVHINKDASEAVKNFTFTNNVIDGATGGSKSGVYAQLTGNVVFTGNVINNVSFRPYVIQLTTDDGIADEFVVTGNTFSGSAVGRAQGLSNNNAGTDTVKLVVSDNIFKDITNAQQICYWNFNPETTTAELSNNYYDIDIAANPSRIYFNSAAGNVADLVNMGIYPVYTALNEDGTIDQDSKIEAPVVAVQIGTKVYMTLQAAVNEVKNGETIVLNADITENVTLTEATGLYYTIDGNGKTMNGTITVKALSDTNDNRRITIKNINFKSDAKVDFISSVETNHYPRLTVEGCSFTGNGKAEAVALRLKSSHSVIIKDCSGSGLHSFLQNTSGWNLTVENVKVTDSKSGLALGTVQGVTVKGCNIDVNGYGIRMDAKNNNNAVIADNTVEAFIPVVVRYAEVNSDITVTGTNTMTATNTDGIWMAVGTSEYEENGKMPTAATSKVVVTLNDTGLKADGIYGNYYVATIGEAIYATLNEAIAAAKAGDCIVLSRDVALTETLVVPAMMARSAEGITLDLNGKTISMADASSATAALLKNEGILTIKDSSAEKTGMLSFSTTTPSAANAYASNTISNYGVLTIESGSIVNTSNGGACYALDNYAGSTATIKGGKLIAEKTAVRVFNWTDGEAAKAVLNVEGGEILSKDGYGINFNMGNAPTVELNISGGTITTNDTDYNLAVYVVSKNDAKNVTINVTGGTFNGYFALNGNTCTTMAAGKVAIEDGTFKGVVCYGTPAYGFISGGTYAECPEDAMLIAGYETDYDKETHKFVIATSAVASVNGKSYTTLADAINAAKNGGTIYLMRDVVLDGKVTVPAGAEFTLNMMGYTLNGSILAPNAKMTILDGTIKNADKTVSALEINAGELTLTNVKIASERHALRIDGDVVATINGGEYKVIGTNKGTYHAMNVSGNANVTIKDGTFVGPKGTSADSGSAVNVQAGATVTIEGGSFSGGKTKTLASKGTLIIVGGTFDQDPSAYVAKDYKAVLNNGKYEVVEKVYVAMIGENGYESFVEALNAVQDGQTITLIENVTGSEAGTEVEFTEAISFTITGKAPEYKLPVVTFQNATVTIKDAEIKIAELDARQNATINVVDSTVYGVGSNDIVKSYYNGAINISGNSVVYTMQVTTMGYITVSDNAKVNATWQTNVYGNGMITVKDDATFATAALHLTGKDYSGRDNTDADRVGKPAEIIVDGANFIVGKVSSSSGADYSYNSSKGINIGTIAGKAAVLTIKNDANVNIYMKDGESANIGDDGIVNMDGTMTVACRTENGTANLVNKGSIVLTAVDAVLTANDCGKVTTTQSDYRVTYADGTYKLTAKVYVAQIDEAKYESLQAAINAAVAGDNTITLLADSAEDVIVKQTEGVNVVIDGNGKVYTGTITIDGDKRKDGAETLTIQNFKFEQKTGNNNHKNIYTTWGEFAHNIVVDNCTFTGTNKTAFGLYLNTTYNVAITNVEATGLRCLIQGHTEYEQLDVENVVVTDSKDAFIMVAGKAMTFKNVEVDVDGRGMWIRNKYNTTTVIEDSTIKCDQPVVFDEADVHAPHQLILNGNNSFTATNASGNWLVTTLADAQAENLTDNLKVVMNDTALDVTKAPALIAKIGNVYYNSLAYAVADAEDGDTVTLLSDVKLTMDDATMVEGTNHPVLLQITEDITLDLNGKTISVEHLSTTERLIAVVYVADGANVVVTGNGTIDVTTDAATPKVAYMFWKRGTTGSLTVKNGTYHMNNSEDSMVYTNGSEIVTIEGGTWTLDKVGTRTNGFPCIFNAAGSNTANIIVTGGTYNADINHQYWVFEAAVAKELALKNNGDGTWTVVPAVAYTGEMEGDYVHRVGYATLVEAVAAADAGETVTLLADNAEDVTIDKAVTLDLNGFNCTGTVTLNAAGVLTTDEDVLTVVKGADVDKDHKVGYVDGAYKIIEKAYTVMIDEDNKFETLAEAIAAANAGDTITFLADIAEDVTIKKDLTIDGAGFKYTGNIAVTGSAVDVIVKNVNFVDGTGYAITTNTIKSITVENCTVTNYGFGFLYANKSTTTVVVKDVTVSGGNYGFHWVYGSDATLENVKMTNVANGLYVQNYASKTITLKNCEITSIAIWERAGYAGVQTFNFEGANTVGALSTSQYAKYVLTEADATLTAPAGAAVTTNVENMAVMYKDGAYKLVTPVAAIGDVLYASIQDAVNAAQDGDVIVVTADHEMIWDGAAKIDGSMAAMVVVAGKSVAIDLNGKNLTVDANKMNGTDLYAVFAADNGGELTLTGTGSVEATGTAFAKTGTTAYCMLMAYEDGTKLTVNGGTYYMETAHDSLIYAGGGDDIVVINDGNFTLGNVGNGTNGKPWIFNTYGGNANSVVVNGGTFNADVNHQFWANEVFVTETKALKNNGNGTWTVVDAAAFVVECATSTGSSDRKVGHATLAEAVAHVKANGTITLLADNAENVEIDKNVTLDVNDKSYTGKITLTADVTLTAVEGLNVVTNVEHYKVVYADGAYKLIAKDYKVQVGEAKFETLAEAIAAAKAGDTITFLADIAEDVTIKKDLTIDGADFKYTGNIAVTGSAVDVIVKNVNFVDGTGYAITTNTIKSITVENCTVTNYGFGFLYANKSTTTVVVKDVTVSGGNYGFHWVYGSDATLENVKMTNVANGLYVQNYASKTITLKNCEITSIAIWERAGYAGVQTFNFEGANTVGALSTSQYAKYVLTEADATLTAPAGAAVTTNVENMLVIYEAGAYKLAKPVAQIGDTKYTSLTDALAEAVEGDVVVMLVNYTDASYATMVSAGVTLDLNGTYLSVKNLLAFGNVIDSTQGVGGLVVTNDRTKALVQLQQNNVHNGKTYMPLYDVEDGCYRFYEYTLTVLTYNVLTAKDAVQFRFRVRLGALEAYKLLGDSANSGVKLSLNLDWDALEDEITYTLNADALKAYADAAYAQVESGERTLATMSKYLGLNVTGISKLAVGTKLIAQPTISSETGVSRTIIANSTNAPATIYTKQ